MMKFLLTFFIPTLVTAVNVGGGVGINALLSPDEQGFIVPGIHKEYLPQPIFYEGYIPLVLEYQTPQWNKSEITFNNWYSCVSETLPYKYSCPVTFHMNQAVVNLHVDFEGIHPAADTVTPRSEEMIQFHFQRLTTSSEFCSKIQKHFPNIYTHASDITTYLEALERCRREQDDTDYGKQILTRRNISDYNYGIRLPFSRMETNFYNVFYKNIVAPDPPTDGSGNSSDSASIAKNPKHELVASGLVSNARTALQAGVLAMFYAEKNRWIHATSDCMQGFIPQSIVTKDKFADSLRNIKMLTVFQQSLELSISPNLMSKYYTLPITDCSHTSDNMFVVRMQIPFIKKNRSKSLQLVQTHTLPFEYKGHVCRIKLGSQTDHTTSGFFEDARGSHFLYEELSGLAFATDCKGNELCKISEYGLSTRSFADRCASALMARNHSIIRNHCQFQCRKQDLSETPLITRIHSNQYVITGSPLNVSIQCQGTPPKVKSNFAIPLQTTSFDYVIESPRIGAHLVNLPCNCAFTLPNTQKFKDLKFFGEGECLSSSKSTSTSPTNDYSSGSPIFTKPEVIPIIPFHFARAKESHSGGGGSFYYENLSPDAKVNLADFLDEQRLETFLFNRGENSGGNRHGNYLPAGDDGSNVTAVLEGGGSCSSVTSLWVIFLITTILIVTFQAYILYLVKRNERAGYVKDERILYKVPDSPVM